MRDWMKDFDREWDKAERSHTRMRRIITAWIAIVWLAAIVGVGALIYFALIASPEQIGAFFGRIASGFDGAAQ